MPDPVTSTAVIAILGNKALDLIENSAKARVKAHLATLLTTAEQKLLGKEKLDAVEEAWANTLAHAYQRALQAFGNVLNPVVNSGAEWVAYRNPVEAFLKRGPVAEHLLETARDPGNNALPDPQLLEREWMNSGGFELPVPLVWEMVAAYFRKGAKDKAFVTPEVREVLNAQNIDAIRALGEKLAGVQITVKQEQYVSRLRKKYAAVELANLAPAYAEDPGALVVSDVFEPQHVRENPPPVEIPRDELEKLARDSKRDGTDDESIIALLDEMDGDSGQNVAERWKFQRASYAEQPVRPVLDVISRKDNRLVVMTGEPGAGKSILMRYLLLGIIDPVETDARREHWSRHFVPTPDEDGDLSRSAEHHFPLLIELRDYYFTKRDEDEVNSFSDYVEYLGETQGYGINQKWLDQRLKSGPSLLMFDGLDEVFDKGDRDEIMQQIVGVTEMYPKARVIVTSRPHGYHETILRPAGFAHFRLQDLDRDQKESFTRGWFGRVFPNSTDDAQERINRVLDSVDRSPSVRWLAGNPLLLTIMCLIAREKELPRERARFYEQCIDVLVHHWQINKHLRKQDDERNRNKAVALLNEDDKKDLLRRIAFRMQGSQAGLRGNFIGERELLELTQSWFEETFPDVVGVQAREAAKLMVTGLWEQNYLLCPRGPKLYGFLHRTFMEFLTATEYVRRFQKTPDFELADLDAVFREHGNDPEWSEVLRLICGEIGDEFADPLIRTLLTLKEFPTKHLNEENQPNHLVLGIRCMSELRGLSKMKELGEFATTQCIAFLRIVRSVDVKDKFLRDGLFDAANNVLDCWPEGLATKHITPVFEDTDQPTTAVFFAQFEAIVFRTKRRIEEYLGHRNWAVRIDALVALAESWTDESTRQLLNQHAVNDESEHVRSQSLELLAGAERWADEPTRQLLSQRAVNDEHWQPRAKALELLASAEQWSDEPTRQLLSQRAVNDEGADVRAIALELLAGAERWAEHEETLEVRRRFIAECIAVKDGGEATCRWFGIVNSSAPLSDAKKRVFSRDIDGGYPYLDPREPVSDEHLAKVAENANLDDEQLAEMVEQMNATLGWDIRKGWPGPTDSER
jgi:hypothetical protein